MGNFRSIGPLGERDVLKKIVIQANPLEIMTDMNLNTEDHVDVSRHNLKSLSFRLTDVYGNTINLHGQNLSFTLIFQPKWNIDLNTVRYYRLQMNEQSAQVCDGAPAEASVVLHTLEAVES